MTHGKHKRVLLGAASLVGLLIAVLLALPYFIDLETYKPEIVAEVKRATGRDAAIDGPIRLSLLPVPSVELDGVKFSNLPGAQNPDMVEVKSVTVKPSLLALLWGEVEVTEVTLVEPRIVLEINAQGKPNWEFAPSVAQARPVAAKPGPPRPLSLGRLTIENGTLSSAILGGRRAAEKATSALRSARSTALYVGRRRNGQRRALKIDLAVSARGAAGAVDVALEAGAQASYKGT